MTRIRIAPLFIALTLAPVLLVAQRTVRPSLDVSTGLSTTRGGVLDYRVGAVMEVLASARIERSPESAIVAGLSGAGIFGGAGDRCLVKPGGGCAEQANFGVVSALVGLERHVRSTPVRVLVGPSYFQGEDHRSLGLQTRIDITRRVLGPIALGVMGRGTVLPRHGGATLVNGGFGLTLALR